MNFPPKVLHRYARALQRRVLGAFAAVQDAFVVSILRRTRTKKPTFDGAQAFTYLVRQCNFGPRNPGSQGHEHCLAYLTETLQHYTLQVTHQRFTYIDRQDPSRRYQGTNIIASFNPRVRTNRIMLCAHWDTRPHADRDPDPARCALPVPGANDGASGVAVLLEMARIMSQTLPAAGVDIVLFDLEDMGDYDFVTNPEIRNPFCIGSAYFAAHLPVPRPRFGILLDMVGKKDLKIGYEGYSYRYAQAIVERVWQAADRVRAHAFQKKATETVLDDHVPFLMRGINVINLIDFDYPHWHTQEDTPDKCCAESLQQVGNVLVEVVYDTS